MEIERKFLVRGEPWHDADSRLPIRQGYLSSMGRATVRVRVGPEMAWLTIKGPTDGISREEFEYTVPRADGEVMLGLCDVIIEKTRHHVRVGAHRWEIDVFEGANAGLVVAEIELDHEDERFDHPAWLGEEVSLDPRYRNAALAERPYSTWED